MKVFKKVLVYLIFPLAIIGLVYLIVESVMEPVRFNNEKAAREQVAIQRLKDIRTLQNAYKTENGKFTASFDTLKSFYTDSSMTVVMQLGSADDSIAVANTEKLKRRNPRIKPEQMLELYKKGERLVFRIENEILVKDTLFRNRKDFNLDSLAIVPFSQGDSIKMQAVVKTVSGVKVPLFEASMTYKSLLKGMDNQLRINLDAQEKERNEKKYGTADFSGLKVGSVTAPNNNAGNWE